MPFPSGRRGVVGVVVETARALGAAEESTALKAKVSPSPLSIPLCVF